MRDHTIPNPMRELPEPKGSLVELPDLAPWRSAPPSGLAPVQRHGLWLAAMHWPDLPTGTVARLVGEDTPRAYAAFLRSCGLDLAPAGPPGIDGETLKRLACVLDRVAIGWWERTVYVYRDGRWVALHGIDPSALRVLGDLMVTGGRRVSRSHLTIGCCPKSAGRHVAQLEAALGPDLIRREGQAGYRLAVRGLTAPS
jgi:hypothetical protein